uniref:RxLR effector protein n=1 Tax=Peronospora matthiolae TaxID=2874970 RepID=A0AAV1VF00_9STRA
MATTSASTALLRTTTGDRTASDPLEAVEPHNENGGEERIFGFSRTPTLPKKMIVPLDDALSGATQKAMADVVTAQHKARGGIFRFFGEGKRRAREELLQLSGLENDRTARQFVKQLHAMDADGRGGVFKKWRAEGKSPTEMAQLFRKAGAAKGKRLKEVVGVYHTYKYDMDTFKKLTKNWNVYPKI